MINPPELLEEMEKTQKEFWNISRETGNFINLFLKASKAKTALEIGTSNGYSSIWIAEALKETGGHLYTIERWDERADIAIENFKNAQVSEIITLYKGDACELIKDKITFSLDFVFIDAQKRQYIDYFNLVHPFINKGGVIIADNVLSHAEKVKEFVDAIKVHPDYQVEVLNLSSGLLIAYKVK